MRNFTLLRHHDVSGVSGPGNVAQGVEFDDLTVSLRWFGARASTNNYACIDDVVSVHCHGDKSEIVWGDASRTPLQKMADYLAEGGECYNVRSPILGDDLRFLVHVQSQHWDDWLTALGGSSDASVFVDRYGDYFPQERRWTSPDGVVTVFHLVRKEDS